MEYSKKTTRELIHICAWIDNEAEATPSEKSKAKNLIKQELNRRFKAVIEFIDDGQNAKNPVGTLDYLLRG